MPHLFRGLTPSIEENLLCESRSGKASNTFDRDRSENRAPPQTLG